MIAAGPIVATLTGAGVGGIVGGISGALIGLGIPEYEAKRYESLVKEGRILLSVNTSGVALTNKAMEVLRNQGAEDVASSDDLKNKELKEKKLAS